MILTCPDWNNWDTDTGGSGVVSWDDLTGKPPLPYFEMLRLAAVERCNSARYTNLPWELVDPIVPCVDPYATERFEALHNWITTLIPKFVNHTDHGGDWTGLETYAPYWTEETILANIDIEYPERCTELGSAKWAKQTREILDRLAWVIPEMDTRENRNKWYGYLFDIPPWTPSWPYVLGVFNDRDWSQWFRQYGSIPNWWSIEHASYGRWEIPEYEIDPMKYLGIFRFACRIKFSENYSRAADYEIWGKFTQSDRSYGTGISTFVCNDYDVEENKCCKTAEGHIPDVFQYTTLIRNDIMECTQPEPQPLSQETPYRMNSWKAQEQMILKYNVPGGFKFQAEIEE